MDRIIELEREMDEINFYRIKSVGKTEVVDEMIEEIQIKYNIIYSV